MTILFDQGTPVPLRDALTGHTVATAYERGWSTMGNGELLAAAEGKASALTVDAVLPGGERDIPTATAATFPNREPDQL